MRVLVLSRAVGWSKDEGGELNGFVDGLLALRNVTDLDGTGLDVVCCDGTTTSRPSRDGAGNVRFDHLGAATDLLRRPPDVVWSHLVLDGRVLALAAGLRARGVPGVLTPVAMLGDDFAARSWFRDDERWRLHLKAIAVRGLRTAWRAASSHLHVAGAHEARMARVDPATTLRSPLPLPNSPLADAVMGDARGMPGDDDRPPAGPVALVSRFDVHRKGFDRLARWLQAHRDDLPRPAVLLLASHDPDPPADIAELVADGLIEWDTTTRGADLLPRLLACRGMVLLSRFEAQPRALREAAIAGVPVLTTPEANWTEVAEALGTGVVVDGDDPADVQAGFERLPTLPRRGGRARALFDRRRLAGFHVAALRDLAEGRSPAAMDDYAAYAAARPLPAEERHR